ncbi:MAG: right-handed parallel beta-helix repeat-containing protein [Candidatus Aenigmatarchaeota archaeon]
MRVALVLLVCVIVASISVSFVYGQKLSAENLEVNEINSPEGICGDLVACQCGDYLSSNHTMWYDITSCSGIPIRIAANNVTLDCNGHLLDGINSMLYEGISNEGYDNVIIKNCEVTDFLHGIKIYSAANNNTLENNTVHDNFDAGLLIIGSQNTIISRNHIFLNNQGIANQNFAHRSVLSKNIAHNNNYGILVGETDYAQLFENVLYENNIYGLRVHKAHNNIFWNNSMYNNSINAFEEVQAENNYWNNSVMGNYWGDFETNPGYPYTYIVPGPFDGIDHKPLGGSFVPEITSTPITEVVGGEFYSYDVEVYYPGSFILNYFLIQYPPEMIIDSLNGLVTWSPNYNQSGNYTVTLRVSDGFLFDEQSYQINVSEAVAPVLEPFQNITVNEMGLVRIYPEALDRNGDDLTYHIDNPVFTWSGSYFQWKTGPSSSGEYDFTVNVTDGVFWDEEPIHVSVNNFCKVFNKKYMCWEGCNCDFVPGLQGPALK